MCEMMEVDRFNSRNADEDSIVRSDIEFQIEEFTSICVTDPDSDKHNNNEFETNKKSMRFEAMEIVSSDG